MAGDRCLLVLRNLYELHFEVNALVDCPLRQHRHNFLYGVSDVKYRQILSKLTRFDLGEVKQILNTEVHELS